MQVESNWQRKQGKWGNEICIKCVEAEEEEDDDDDEEETPFYSVALLLALKKMVCCIYEGKICEWMDR